MSYTLIIAEKPSAARKIASALADNAVSQEKKNSVMYFKLTHNKEEIIIAPAVGHLFGVTTAETHKEWTYPVFDIVWLPTYETNKNAGYAKKYLSNIVALSKKAGTIVIACDYDIEGETIGYTILKYGCKKESAKRMKFSTLTKKELIDSYDGASPALNMGLAMAGTTRHVLDFYFGINISRALTLALKAKGKYKVLSAGRVQGPALYFLARREKEVQAFVPEPFWQIQADCKKEDVLFKAMHKDDKIFDKEKAKNIFSIVKGQKTAIVDCLKEKEYKVNPPSPFNLSDLQMEAYKLFKVVPKECQNIAQKLYEAALISYPRTSSQKLDPKLGFSGILDKLAKNNKYTAIANEVLKTSLTPNNGKKDDSAHPAIYPTGELQKGGLSSREEKVYDLIVKRFFSCFGKAAVRKSVDVTLDIKKELFAANGKTTLEENWFRWYAPYVKIDETTLPKMTEKDLVDVEKITLLQKETQPPARYNEASIIKELERRELGTKATRADIIGNLFKRGYLKEKRIEVTELGMKVIDTLEKYCPEIISEEMTRRFEKELEEIEKNTEQSPKTIDEAKQEIAKISAEFKANELKIGESLMEAVFESQRKENHIGKCPNCDNGNLVIKRGKYGRFIACDQYPECKSIVSIPQKGMIKSAGKLCPVCSHPMISIIRAKKKPQELCINKNCKSKQVDVSEEGEKKDFGKCPKCGAPLVERSSIYGKFLGCSKYPKCKTIVKLNSKKQDS